MDECPACREVHPGGGCGECGRVLNQPVDGDASSCSFRLEINDAHPHVAGFRGVIDVRLTNTSAIAMERITLSIAGVPLGEGGNDVVGTLSPGRTVNPMIRIKPDVAGVHLVDISMKFRGAGVEETWRTQALLKVLRETDSVKSLTVNIDQSTNLTGDKIGFGQSIRKEVHEGLIGDVIKDVNDLLSREFPPSWHTLTLTRDNIASDIQILPALMSRGPGLAPAMLADRIPDARRRVLLLSKPVITLGRSRACDIVLRLLPRSHEQDQQTQFIQGTDKQPHCTLALSDRGLELRDNETKNGTWLDDDRIDEPTLVSLNRPSVLNLANVLRVRLTPLCDVQAEHADAGGRRYKRQLDVADDPWKWSAGVGLRAILMERVDNLRDTESYIVVYRWLNVPAEVPLGFIESLGEEPAARLVNVRGQIWMEVCRDQPDLRVAGRSRECGSVFPITAGLQCEFGSCAAVFAPVAQFGLG